MRRVCALVEAGDVAGRNPLLPPLGARLAAEGLEFVVWDPTRAVPLPAPAPPADLYLVKGDHPAVLSTAAQLHDAGASCLNRLDVTLAAADKARTSARLRRAGLPVPDSRLVGDRDELDVLLARRGRVVKPLHGAHGDGVAVLGPREAGRAPSGPWLVQEVVAGPGYDLKVYGVGERAAVRKVRVVAGKVDVPREPAEGRREVVELGVAAAAALDLDCWGVDVIASPDGPMIVDVNSFPGYRGVPEAVEWLAARILKLVGGA